MGNTENGPLENLVIGLVAMANRCMPFTESRSFDFGAVVLECVSGPLLSKHPWMFCVAHGVFEKRAILSNSVQCNHSNKHQRES